MKRSLQAVLLIAVFDLATCTPQAPHRAPLKPTEHPFFTETGEGSLCSNRLVGRKTAAGGRFTQGGLTAAHQTLPFGTIVRVTNIENGLSVKVSIDDRGPFAKHRVIDLSSAAARALGIREAGVANVKLEAFKTDQCAALAEKASSAPASCPLHGADQRIQSLPEPGQRREAVAGIDRRHRRGD